MSALPRRPSALELVPFIAVGVGYSLVGYLRPLFVLPERVVSCGLRKLDLTLFNVAGHTLGETLSSRTSPIIDLLCAIPYTVFLYWVFVYAGWLFFRDRRRSLVFGWAFAIANCLAFVCWLALPAAPPWYLHAHGCVVDPSTPSNPAGLLRVDALLHIHYFRDFYARAATPFGAMPSLHCAYPMIGLLSAWRSATGCARLAHAAYALLMAYAALYLDHHWLVDVLAGWVTALVAVTIARHAFEASQNPASRRKRCSTAE